MNHFISHTLRDRTRGAIVRLGRSFSLKAAVEYAVIAVTLSGTVLLGGTVIGLMIETYGTPAAGKIVSLTRVDHRFTAGSASFGWGILDEIQGWIGVNGIEIQTRRIIRPGGYPGDWDFVFEMDAHPDKADKYSKTYDQFNDDTDVQISFQTALRNHPVTREGSDGVNVYWNGERVRTVYPNKSGWEEIMIDVNTSDGDGSGVLTLEDLGTDDGAGAYVGDVAVTEIVDDATGWRKILQVFR